MHAVIKTGGKQYKVAAGDKIKVEQISADVGSVLQLDQVLAVYSGEQFRFGTPLVQGASVSVTVIHQGRHDKVKIFKMRRRKHYQKRQGHRQNYTELFISGITSDLGETTADSAKWLERRRGEGASRDDLTKIEGIGPKIAELLVAAGIRSFQALAAAPQERLKAVLAQGGSRFAIHDPSTWAEQADLAAKGEWEAFKKLTDELHGGRRV